MCDYSLEMYQSRPATAGERYETHRFKSGSIGFIAPGAQDVAVCMACDTILQLENIPENIGVGKSAKAMFVRLELGPHHDGVRFENGKEVSLQQLGSGVSGSFAEATVDGLPATKTTGRAIKRTLETVVR